MRGSSYLFTTPRPGSCVLVIAVALAFLGSAVAGGVKPPIRDVTPSDVIRVYRDAEAKSISKDATWLTKVSLDSNGNLLANGQVMKLYAVAIPERRKICKSAQGERWACGQQSFLALRNLIGPGPVACEFKGGGNLAVCWVEGVDISRWLLEEGCAELPDD